jgi:hypothetical protein
MTCHQRLANSQTARLSIHHHIFKGSPSGRSCAPNADRVKRAECRAVAVALGHQHHTRLAGSSPRRKANSVASQRSSSGASCLQQRRQNGGITLATRGWKSAKAASPADKAKQRGAWRSPYGSQLAVWLR